MENKRKYLFWFLLLSFAIVFTAIYIFYPKSKNYQFVQHNTEVMQKTPDSLAFKKPENNKIVYLTLDADMNQSMYKKLIDKQVDRWYDPQLFDYLKNNNISASFFVSGLFAETYPDLIKSLNATGNYTFENHGYDESGFTPHCYKLDTLTTDEEKIDQINKTQKIVKDLTGRIPIYFRFPGICQSQHDDELVAKLGLKNNDGDIVASDPFNDNTDAIVKNIYRQMKPGGVIIMHVGGQNAPKSLEVLKQIIPYLQNEGYSIKHLE